MPPALRVRPWTRSCAVSEAPQPPPLPGREDITVGKHACQACGGDMVWDAARQMLRCPFCGTQAAWSPAAPPLPGQEGIAELDLEAALASAGQHRGWGEASREVRCQSCQAVSVFQADRVAQRCEFCGSPSIIDHQASEEAITPGSLLPFQHAEGQVRDLLRRWYGSRRYAPSALKRAALTDTLHGIYLPYWTFDAHVDARWRADAGHYYYVPVSYRDASGTTRTRMERRVRWVPASGELQHFFDDLLQPGSTGVHAPLLRQIGPFPVKELRAYSPEYVRGWTVERYQVDLPRAAQAAAMQMDQRTRELCAGQVPGDTYRNLQVQARYSGRTFKHVLVPVWLVTYRYGRKRYQVAVNGYTGVVAGERPYSVWKIFATVLAVLLGLVVLWLLMR